MLSKSFALMGSMEMRYGTSHWSHNSCMQALPGGKRSVLLFIPYETSFSLVFWEEEWLVEGDPLYLKFWVNKTSPRWCEIADFEPIFARSASVVTPSEKSSINTLGSPLYALYNEPKMIIVLPKPLKGVGGSKTQRAVFGVKSHFAWRKSATKFLCVKTVAAKL